MNEQNPQVRVAAERLFRLPATLPDKAELTAINQQVRDGAIWLDWRDVVEATPDQLAILLHGLALDKDFDAMGGESIPDTLQPLIAIVLAQNEGVMDTTEDTSGEVTAEVEEQPALWMPTEEIEVEEDEESGIQETSEESERVLEIPAPVEIRAELETMVIKDLLGPVGGEEEEIDEFRVHDRYMVGILASIREGGLPAEEQESQGTAEEGTEESGPVDSDNSQANSMNPSSMGISFCVDLHAKVLKVTARWGHYRKMHIPRENGSEKFVWKRTPRLNSHNLPLQETTDGRWLPQPDEQPDVYVKSIMRRAADCWMVTLFLVNEQRTPEKMWDSTYLYQPELIIESPGGPIFQRRSAELQRLYKPEDKMLAMLYRHRVGFAIGHGVSVHVDTLKDDPTSAVRLSTSFIPRYEIARTDAPDINEMPLLNRLCLDMKELAESTPDTLADKLRPLVQAYAGWIEEQERRITDPDEHLAGYRQVAEEVTRQCRQTLTRIQEGIDAIASDAQAAQAFGFMNRAMWQQRVHTIYSEAQRQGHEITLAELDSEPMNHSWRPFQLAFILLNLPALTDLHHPDRSTGSDAIADLLWFPTGGGKTEAYLGLTAYTLAMRRLQGEVEGRSGLDGVAVIMRYTLRLLTLQQFQRAAALICACEVIRKADPQTWGETPFRLGLWVGQRSTPNSTEESKQAIDKAHAQNGRFIGHSNPRQLTHCPWCGCEIAAGRDIRVEAYGDGRGRTLTYCSDGSGQCAFSYRQAAKEGLPVLVVDEEIYRLLPALLIATVDKFAQLPWRGETQMLFGQVDKYCERHGFRSPEIHDTDSHPKKPGLQAAKSYAHGPLRPPDLIIQDELHLIAGPLGSMVGLYETSIDHLATWQVGDKAVRPKVIAATATIRQAEEQVRALFMRKLNIFPPQGLDIEDNFFARQRPTSEAPGRVYLGICASGRRMKAVQIRVYLAFLAAAQKLFLKYGRAADPWMTLVGYFNSMGELGSMRHMVDDDINNRIWRMDQRGLAKRSRPLVRELNSRISSADIPTVLSELDRIFVPVNKEERTAGKKTEKPIDILLATNMISVGVDIKRLGLMVVTGQPKTTAEYIQATSRVGRSFPGLVCIVYNWMRPRDLSHYEQFEYYHATFYQQVEALSVTPFAPRALDRGLAALLTSIVRLSNCEMSKNDTAGELTADSAILEQAITAITSRADEETREEVNQQLERLKKHWLDLAETRSSVNYDNRRGANIVLLSRPERGEWKPFTCLNSLRNVEPTVNLLLDERDLGKPGSASEEEEES